MGLSVWFWSTFELFLEPIWRRIGSDTLLSDIKSVLGCIATGYYTLEHIFEQLCGIFQESAVIFCRFNRFFNEFHWILSENPWYFIKMHDTLSKSMIFHQNLWDFIKIHVCRNEGLSGCYGVIVGSFLEPTRRQLGQGALLCDIKTMFGCIATGYYTLEHILGQLCGILQTTAVIFYRFLLIF